ncbi:MAG: endonuclease III domain-containing protein [Leptospirales bacterium]
MNLGKTIDFLQRIKLFLEEQGIPEPAAELLTGAGNPYQVLIMTILSLRTKDEVTLPSSKRLFEQAPTLQHLSRMKLEAIERSIFPVGFYRTKSKTIKRIAEILLEQYDGKVPDTLSELLALPGVGLKTANLVLTVGHEKEGFCVDIHVHRILNRWGSISTKDPDETYHLLEPALPPIWKRRANALLVSFGQHICRPVSPYCSKCPLSVDCDRIKVDKYR